VSPATSASTPSAIAAPSRTNADASVTDRLPLALSKISFRPINEARLVPCSGARFERAHARLVAEVARKPVRVAIAGPGLEANEWRPGPRPERGVLKARVLHHDRCARGVDEGERTAGAVQETERVTSEQRVGKRQVRAPQGNRTHRLAD